MPPKKDRSIIFRSAGTVWMQAQNEKIIQHLPGTIKGKDPEELHDMRVATRRLRAAMLVFHACFPDYTFPYQYRRVSDLTKALGSVRDMDVQREAVIRRRDALPEELRPDVDRWLERLAADREEARARMIEELEIWQERNHSEHLAVILQEVADPSFPVRRDAIRARRLMLNKAEKDGLRMAKAKPIPSCPSAPLAVNAALPILTRLSEMLAYSDLVRDPARVQDLHKMRIAAKRLRYTIEVFSSVLEGSSDFLNLMKRIQDLLGKIHDADVLQVRLTRDMDDEGWTPGLQALLQATLVERATLYAEFIGEWNQAIEEDFPNRLRASALEAALGEPVSPSLCAGAGEEVLRAVVLTALAPYVAENVSSRRANAIRRCVQSLLALAEEPAEYRNTDPWRGVLRKETKRLFRLLARGRR